MQARELLSRGFPGFREPEVRGVSSKNSVETRVSQQPDAVNAAESQKLKWEKFVSSVESIIRPILKNILYTYLVKNPYLVGVWESIHNAEIVAISAQDESTYSLQLRWSADTLDSVEDGATDALTVVVFMKDNSIALRSGTTEVVPHKLFGRSNSSGDYRVTQKNYDNRLHLHNQNLPDAIVAFMQWALDNEESTLLYAEKYPCGMVAFLRELLELTPEEFSALQASAESNRSRKSKKRKTKIR